MRKIKTMAALLVCLAMLCVLPATIHAENEQPVSSPTLPMPTENEDETNPVMTPENQAKLEAYEAKLRAEMEEDGVSLMAVDENIPTFNQYLADYNYNFNLYKFYKNDFKLPYRSFVETKRESEDFQTALGMWRIATFELTDVAKYNNKEIGFYESILFDIFYQGKDQKVWTDIISKNIKGLQASTHKKIFKFLGAGAESILNTDTDKLSKEQKEQLANAIANCSEVKDVFKAISDVGKIVEYGKTAEELIYKIAKAQAISDLNDESAKVLLMMKDYSRNPALTLALDNMILIHSGAMTDEQIAVLLTLDTVASELSEELFKTIWKGVTEHLGVYGYAVSAAQAVGKMLTGWWFSTDKSIEEYYNLCALYDFEDVLKQAMTVCEGNYLSSPSDENSKLFNDAYKMLLNTYLLGIKGSQEYIDIEYTKGLVKNLLFGFKAEQYEEYSKKLKEIQSELELTIRFINTDAYNWYKDIYCADVAPQIGMNTDPPIYNKEQCDEASVNLDGLSFETNNVVIDKDMTLENDLHTYGSVLLQSGILSLNGHYLHIDGNFDCTNGRIYMTNENDYLLCEGNFTVGGGDCPTDHLSAGTVEIKGNFSQIMLSSRNYYATGSHKTILSGVGKQEVYFECFDGGCANRFNFLDIQNADVTFTSPLYDFILYNDVTLNQDTNLNTTAGVDLSGHKLKVNGNLSVTGSNLNINGGTLETTGNCSISSHLVMRNENDYILCGGDFTISGGDCPTDHLSAGTVEIKGNFSQIMLSSRNYYATGSHKTILSGVGKQEVYFECFDGGCANAFNYLEIKNPLGPVQLTSNITINSSLFQPGGSEIQNSEMATLDGKPAFEDMGGLNSTINKFVGNAENVIPTWKDVEKYYLESDKPKYNYIIGKIMLNNPNGDIFNKTPCNESFSVSMEITKLSSDANNGNAIVAIYGTSGQLLYIDYAQIDILDIGTQSFGFNVPAQTSEIGEIKAFVWHSFSDPQPLAESKTL